MIIRTLNGDINFNPQGLSEETVISEKESLMRNGLKKLFSESSLSYGSMSDDDTELRKKKHTDLEDNDVSPNSDNSITPIAPSSHFDNSYRFSKANQVNNSDNVQQVLNRLKSQHGLDYSQDQKVIDSIAFALEYQRHIGVKFDADQSMNSVVDNIAKDKEYYSKDMSNVIVGQDDEKEKEGEPTPQDVDDYDKPDENSSDAWWQGRYPDSDDRNYEIDEPTMKNIKEEIFEILNEVE